MTTRLWRWGLNFPAFWGSLKIQVDEGSTWGGDKCWMIQAVFLSEHTSFGALGCTVLIFWQSELVNDSNISFLGRRVFECFLEEVFTEAEAGVASMSSSSGPKQSC
jgi:hypothetical protein